MSLTGVGNNGIGVVGVGSRQYAVQGSGVWTDASSGRFTVLAPADHRNDGVHVFDIRALDRAGNAGPHGPATRQSVGFSEWQLGQMPIPSSV